MIYKLYDGQPLKSLSAKKTAAEVGTLGVVVIRNSQCTAKEFADWSLDLGYHLSPQIWCTDREESDLFWRVTNQKVDADHQGLLGDHEPEDPHLLPALDDLRGVLILVLQLGGHGDDLLIDELAHELK